MVTRRCKMVAWEVVAAAGAGGGGGRGRWRVSHLADDGKGEDEEGRRRARVPISGKPGGGSSGAVTEMVEEAAAGGG